MELKVILFSVSQLRKQTQEGKVTCPSSHSLISSRAGFKQVVYLQSLCSILLCNWVQVVLLVYSGMRTE